MTRRVFVLELIDAHGDGRFRVFARREAAVRVARRWTGARGGDASASEWRGVGDRSDYDADLYQVVVEP